MVASTNQPTNLPSTYPPTPLPPNHNQPSPNHTRTGLGYRAKFIRETAQKLQALGKEEWLLGLRAQARGEVQVRYGMVGVCDLVWCV